MKRPLLALATILLLAGCSSKTETPAPDTMPHEAAQPEEAPAMTDQPAEMPTEHASDEVQPGQEIPLLSGQHTVILHTNKGDITLVLDADKSPMAVTNFVMLAKAKLFDRLENGVFKTEPGMLFQAGDIAGNGIGASIFGSGFKDEDLHPLEGGDIAMVNNGPDTNGSAFMIVTSDVGLPWLKSYSVFGKVTEGMDIAKQIADAPHNEESHAPDEAVSFTVEVQE